MPKAKTSDDPKFSAALLELLTDTERYETEWKVCFRPGTSKGRTYTVDDCKEMAQHSEELHEQLEWRPALTLGHDPKQPMAHALGLPFDPQGFPDFGRSLLRWVDDYDEDGGALLSKLTGLPRVLSECIDNDRYGTLSIVLAPYVTGPDGKTKMRNVVGQVALLGAEVPGFFRQKDRVTMADPVVFAMGDGEGKGELLEWGTSDAPADAAPEGGDEMDWEKEAKRLQALLDGVVTKMQELLAKPGLADSAAALEALGQLVKEHDLLKTQSDELKKQVEQHATDAKKVEAETVVQKAVDDGTMLPKDAPAAVAFAMTCDNAEVIPFAMGEEDDPENKGKKRPKVVEATRFAQYLDGVRGRGKLINFSDESGEGDDPTQEGDGDGNGDGGEGGGAEPLGEPTALQAKVWKELGLDPQKVLAAEAEMKKRLALEQTAASEQA